MFDLRILIANIVTVIAQLFLLHASTRKTKKETIVFQLVFLVLISIRNILAYYDKSNNVITVLMVLISTSLGLYFNNNGIFGIFPIIANISETVTILNPKSTIAQIKISGIISNSCWVIMTIVIKNYVGTIFDFMAAIGYASYFFQKNKSHQL